MALMTEMTPLTMAMMTLPMALTMAMMVRPMARKTDWICEGEVLDLDAGGLGGGGATYARDDGAHFDGLWGVGCGWLGLVVEVGVGVVFVLVVMLS